MVKKLLLTIILLAMVPSVFAAENVAGTSANLSIPAKNNVAGRISYKTMALKESRKRQALASILDKYQSPMKGSVDTFMSACISYNLDCYLLPSISGLESGFGHYIAPNSYNPFGWGGGYIRFEDWNQAIDTVGYNLKTRYIGSGAQTIEQIGSMYAESPTWAARVRGYMAMFQQEEEQNPLNSSTFDLQL